MSVWFFLNLYKCAKYWAKNILLYYKNVLVVKRQRIIRGLSNILDNRRNFVIKKMVNIYFLITDKIIFKGGKNAIKRYE